MLAKGHGVTETCFELASAGLPVWYAPMGLRWSAADGSALCSAYEQRRGPAQAPINAWAGPGVAASQVPVKGKGSPAPGCDGKDGAGPSHQGVEGGKMWKDVERCGKMWKDVERCGKMWKDVERCGKMWKVGICIPVLLVEPLWFCRVLHVRASLR